MLKVIRRPNIGVIWAGHADESRVSRSFSGEFEGMSREISLDSCTNR
jgi:hypothetical protein